MERRRATLLKLILLVIYVNFICTTVARRKDDSDDSDDDDDCTRNGKVSCFPKKSTIPHVILLDNCKKFYQLDTAVDVRPTQTILTPIGPCLSCDMKLRTAQSNQTVTAIFYSLGLQGASGGLCRKIRLDIYDGWFLSPDTLLSNKNGICGWDLPNQSFQSTNNTLTIRLKTACWPRQTQYGTFEIVVTATEKASDQCRGQFECGSGQCIDKDFVCDGQPQCPDHSDETGCSSHHRNVIPTWFIVIFVLIAVALFVLFLVTMTLVCLKYLCYNGYTRV